MLKIKIIEKIINITVTYSVIVVRKYYFVEKKFN